MSPCKSKICSIFCLCSLRLCDDPSAREIRSQWTFRCVQYVQCLQRQTSCQVETWYLLDAVCTWDGRRLLQSPHDQQLVQESPWYRNYCFCNNSAATNCINANIIQTQNIVLLLPFSNLISHSNPFISSCCYYCSQFGYHILKALQSQSVFLLGPTVKCLSFTVYVYVQSLTLWLFSHSLL